MAHRGHLDGLGAQASGLMRHGSFPAASLSGRATLDPATATLEILENKLAMQTAEVEKLIRENQKLASSHVVLRQDIVDTEKEMQMIRAHLGEVQTETDMQIRDLLERIRLMDADIHSGDAVKKELIQVHMEAKRLTTERQMLTLEIENVTKELNKLSASADNKSLPELVAELDGLRKEHHNLRSQFEFEKNTNIKQVEQMRTMEMNLITMTKEAEKLHADVANAEKRAQAAQAATGQVTSSQPGTAQATAAPVATNPYASAYGNHPSAYQQGTQPVAYQQGAQAGAYQQAAQTGAYQQGTQAGAYQQGAQAGAYQQASQARAYQQGAQAGAYQQGAQAGAYQQAAQTGAYQQGAQTGAYAYPTAYDAATAYQMHAAQANTYAGYSGYPVAGYAQHGYPAAYAAPSHPVTNPAATDVANLYGAIGSTGYPAGPVQSGNAAANAGQAVPPPPSEPYPGSYAPTREAQS